MPRGPDTPASREIPLVADLDGTLIRTDLLWEYLARLLRRNPLQILAVLFWWSRSRAKLKQKLAARVIAAPAALPYNKSFLAWLCEQKAAGRKIILATASDLKMAQPVADYIGIFDEVLGSDGKTNLRGENKLRALTAKFGERGFDYAGNSSADFAVWRGARQAIVVNASASVREAAAGCTALGPAFPEHYSPLVIPRRVLTELFIRSGYLLAVAAGLLLAGAFPAIGIAGFAWVAPGLMAAAARGKPGGDAFRSGYVAGLVFWLASLDWLLQIPVAGFPALGWCALSAFAALYLGIWTWLLSAKYGVGGWTQRTFWCLAGAAAWVALELVRSRLLGGFPWNPLGASQFKLTPLIQIASVTGVYGVSFLVTWVSLSLFSAWRTVIANPNARFGRGSEMFLPLLTVAILFAAGWFHLRSLQNVKSIQPPLRVTMIQPSVPQSLIWDTTANSNRLQKLLELTETALKQPADLLIWPESSLPQFDPASYAAITNLAITHHLWMVFNADDTVMRASAATPQDVEDFNAAFFFNPDGNVAGIYHKRKLVVFGEYVPLMRWLPFLEWFTPIQGGYEAGEEPATFSIILTRPNSSDSPEAASRRIINASPLICFEDVFPQTARESVRTNTDFLVNLTNDGWFGEGSEQWQQAANAVFRAVENHVPLVRCCNNGLTCWVDANGQLREIFKDAEGRIYGPGFMSFALPLSAERPPPTFYNRHGDWFGWMCVAATLVLIGLRLKNWVFHRQSSSG